MKLFGEVDMNDIWTVILIIMLLVCAIQDMITKHIHIVLLIVFGLAGVASILIPEGRSLTEIISGIGIGVVFIGLSFVSREKIGMGDALLLLDCSLFLGFWKELILVWLACTFSGITAFILVFLLKKGRNYRIAFAPFVLVASIVVSFLV